jgi:hypothetical protein
MKSYHLQVNGWNWSTSSWARLARLRRPIIICFPSYVDFRSWPVILDFVCVIGRIWNPGRGWHSLISQRPDLRVAPIYHMLLELLKNTKELFLGIETLLSRFWLFFTWCTLDHKPQPDIQEDVALQKKVLWMKIGEDTKWRSEETTVKNSFKCYLKFPRFPK